MDENIENDLCLRCRAIDLDDLFQNHYSRDRVEDVPVLILGKITADWVDSSCRLCQFFLSMIHTHGYPENVEFALFKAKIGLRNSSDPDLFKSIPGNSIIASIMIKGLDEPQYPRRDTYVNYSKEPDVPILLDPTRVDYKPLRQWYKRFLEWESMSSRKIGELPLLVIDCDTRELVKVSVSTEYFALSYVWGPAPGQESALHGNSLPASLPATVEDAMTVVREIGLRYLWVDRYCLDRSNPAEFQSQLNMMAGIYRNAVATIIAAAGSDANYGLPGVGYRNRIKQPCVKIGAYTLWSSMSDPRTTVRESVWMSRAWTYQEGVCSRNWIAFTDEQVFYHRSNTGYEKMERGWQVSCEMFPNGGLGGADPKCPIQKMFDLLQNSPGGLHQHIGRYVTRELSYQSDVLNGMLGVLQRCGTGPYPINHYFGVPILGPLKMYRLASPRADDVQWTLTDAFLVGLFWISEGWESQGSGQRRHGFPSWSWTGWLGSYGAPSIPLIQHGLSNGSDIKLKVNVFESGQLVDWEKMCYARDWNRYEDVSLLPQELHIEAPTMIVSICRVPEGFQGTACCKSSRPEPMTWAAKFSGKGYEILVKVNLVDPEIEEKLQNLTTVPLKAVFLRQVNVEQEECTESRRHNFIRCCALLVKEAEIGATKAGILELSPDNYLVQWTDENEKPTESNEQFCGNCKRAMLCLMEGREIESTKLI